MCPHRAERLHLPGDAAGGRPGWQERITGAVDANERAKADRRGAGMRNWPARITMVSDIEFRRLLRRAADARGMSATGYARRATAAFVASDLGLDFSSVCALLPKPSPPEGTMKGLPKDQHPLHHPGRWEDDGVGHGSWQVCPDD